MSVSGSGGGGGANQQEFLSNLLQEQTNQQQQQQNIEQQQQVQTSVEGNQKAAHEKTQSTRGGEIATAKTEKSKKAAKEQAATRKSTLTKADAKQAALQAKMTTGKGDQYGKPKVEGEGVTNFSAQFGNLGHGRGINLVAIMAEVLLMQSQSSSNFWKTMWNEASQEMNEQMNLAPVIAQATIDSYNEQAEQSESQANMELVSGIVNLSLVAGAVVLGAAAGAASDAADAGTEITEDATMSSEDEVAAGLQQGPLMEGQDAMQGPRAETEMTAQRAGTTGGEGAADATNAPAETENVAPAETDSVAQGASETAGELADVNAETTEESEGLIQGPLTKAQTEEVYGSEASSMTQRIKNFGSKIAKAWGNASPVSKAFMKGMEMSMGLQMVSQGITGITNYSYNMKIAQEKKIQGMWEAVTSELNIDVQYFGEAFGRTDSVMQGQQQLINTVNQDLTEIAQSIEQALAQGWSSAA